MPLPFKRSWEYDEIASCRRSLTSLIPSYRDVEDLMGVPLVLEMIREEAYAAQPNSDGKVRLVSFASRADVFARAFDRICNRSDPSSLDGDNASIDPADYRDDWQLMLSAVAYEMMLREVWDYRLPRLKPKRVTADEVLRAAKRRVQSQLENKWSTAWKELRRFSPLSDHNVMESVRANTLSFRLKGWMEYFCGCFVSQYSEWTSPDELAEFAAHPEWSWAWRFAI